MGNGLGRRCFGASSKEKRTGTGEMSGVQLSGLRGVFQRMQSVPRQTLTVTLVIILITNTTQ